MKPSSLAVGLAAARLRPTLRSRGNPRPPRFCGVGQSARDNARAFAQRALTGADFTVYLGNLVYNSTVLKKTLAAFDGNCMWSVFDNVVVGRAR